MFTFIEPDDAGRFDSNIEFVPDLHNFSFLILLVTNYEEAMAFVTHLDCWPAPADQHRRTGAHVFHRVILTHAMTPIMSSSTLTVILLVRSEAPHTRRLRV